MTEIVSSMGLAGIFYASTNIDGGLILAVFFANGRARELASVAGRYLGLAALVLASAGAAGLALGVPPGWIALLGLVPLGPGLRLLLTLLSDGGKAGGWGR